MIRELRERIFSLVKISSSSQKKLLLCARVLHQHTTHKKKLTLPASEQQVHVSAAARRVFARKEALLFALIVLPLLFDLLFSLVVVLE